MLEVCLGTPEGTDCLLVGRQDGDLRPSDISSVLEEEFGCETAVRVQRHQCRFDGPW